MSQYKTVSCCKGTTKNAHTQVKRAIFFENRIDLSICIRYSTPHSSSLEGEVLEIGCKRCNLIFKKYCSRTVVCSAFCERSFGGMLENSFEHSEIRIVSNRRRPKVQPFSISLSPTLLYISAARTPFPQKSSNF